MHEVFEGLAAGGGAGRERVALSDDRGAVTARALAARIASLAAALPERAATIGVSGPAGASWVVADLAATLAGRRVVPVPSFFSESQVSHVLADAGVDLLLACDSADPGLRELGGVPVRHVDGHAQVRRGSAVPRLFYAGGAQRVIYTSGTTGAPKGVLHGDRQLSHAIRAIANAVHAHADDLHLSALPPSLLLEQIAGVFIPLALGARVHVSAYATGSAMSGDVRPLLALFARLLPSTTVLVPQLLAAITAAARTGGWAPPPSLRFAAVGGAPIPIALVHAARAARIPVIRGYGLSECASVVAVERPGAPSDATDGACGKPLDGVCVAAEDGVLAVRAPTVMDGYLGRARLAEQVWSTGDVGRVTPHGTLVVDGRCDRVLVLPSGRNVCADWVEACVLADARIAGARLALAGDGTLELTAALHPRFGSQLRADAGIHAQVAARLAGLPAYARPARIGFTIGGEPVSITMPPPASGQALIPS